MLSGELEWKLSHGCALDTIAQRVRTAIGASAQAFVPPSVPLLAAPIPSAPPPPVQPGNGNANLFIQLQTLIEWYEKGLLSESEFKAAKIKLGLC